MAEEHQRMMNRLPEDSLRFIAEQKMEGLTNEELATILKLTTRSIERKLARIRECWESEIQA